VNCCGIRSSLRCSVPALIRFALAGRHVMFAQSALPAPALCPRGRLGGRLGGVHVHAHQQLPLHAPTGVGEDCKETSRQKLYWFCKLGQVVLSRSGLYTHRAVVRRGAERGLSGVLRLTGRLPGGTCRLQAHPGAPFLSKSGSLPLVVHRRAFTTQVRT
jgi:hypothetical protein